VVPNIPNTPVPPIPPPLMTGILPFPIIYNPHILFVENLYKITPI
jgi:hypothetical protein